MSQIEQYRRLVEHYGGLMLRHGTLSSKQSCWGFELTVGILGSSRFRQNQDWSPYPTAECLTHPVRRDGIRVRPSPPYPLLYSEGLWVRKIPHFAYPMEYGSPSSNLLHSRFACTGARQWLSGTHPVTHWDLHVVGIAVGYYGYHYGRSLIYRLPRKAMEYYRVDAVP